MTRIYCPPNEYFLLASRSRSRRSCCFWLSNFFQDGGHALSPSTGLTRLWRSFLLFAHSLTLWLIESWFNTTPHRVSWQSNWNVPDHLLHHSGQFVASFNCNFGNNILPLYYNILSISFLMPECKVGPKATGKQTDKARCPHSVTCLIGKLHYHHKW